MTPIEQSLVLFIVGGINVLLTGWLGNYMSPLMAALFWSYPWTAIPPMFFMKWKGKSNLYLSKYLSLRSISAAWSMDPSGAS